MKSKKNFRIQTSIWAEEVKPYWEFLFLFLLFKSLRKKHWLDPLVYSVILGQLKVQASLKAYLHCDDWGNCEGWGKKGKASQSLKLLNKKKTARQRPCAVFHPRNFLNWISSHRRNAKMRDFSLRGPAMKLIIEMLVPHIILFKLCHARSTPPMWSLVRCLKAGNSPGGSGRGEEKALMELLFEELICAPERLGFSIPNETNYMIWIHIAHPFT
jgi:hypothetical protein